MTQLLSTLRKQRGIAIAGIALSLSGAMAASVAWERSAAAATPHVRALFAGVTHHANAMLRDPRRNVAPSPNYLDLCAVSGSNNKQCLSQSLTAINNARAAEGIRPMILPDNYAKLTIPQQTFVVTDLERVDRGLRPVIGLTPRLNANAHNAAVNRTDPSLVGALLSLLGVRSYASIWAGDFGPLASDYDWMYNDGYSPSGSVNLDCRTPGSAGCWGHRHCILALFAGLPTVVAGAGTSRPIGLSIAEVFAGSNRRSFPYSFTWKQALAHGADGHKVTA